MNNSNAEPKSTKRRAGPISRATKRQLENRDGRRQSREELAPLIGHSVDAARDALGHYDGNSYDDVVLAAYAREEAGG